ncbi:hypothetical protein EGI94_20020 [Stutzerimonas stutzeri]|nr:hypothetical protein EGI94_20020 [Stutzerimonas stutzeri]
MTSQVQLNRISTSYRSSSYNRSASSAACGARGIQIDTVVCSQRSIRCQSDDWLIGALEVEIIAVFFLDALSTIVISGTNHLQSTQINERNVVSCVEVLGSGVAGVTRLVTSEAQLSVCNVDTSTTTIVLIARHVAVVVRTIESNAGLRAQDNHSRLGISRSRAYVTEFGAQANSWRTDTTLKRSSQILNAHLTVVHYLQNGRLGRYVGDLESNSVISNRATLINHDLVLTVLGECGTSTNGLADLNGSDNRSSRIS